MKEAFKEIVTGHFKRFIPFLLTLFLVLVNFIPVHLPLSHFFRPDLALVCVYFWVLYRHDLFGILSVIILGVVFDSLSGAPFGMNIGVLMFAYILTTMYSKYMDTKSFFMTWVGFAIIGFLAFSLKWLLFSLYYKTFLSFIHILMGYIVSVLIYPFVARGNVFVENTYLSTNEVLDE